MSKYYSIHEFSKIIGVSAQTLRNWDANGKLHPHHTTVSGYRYYSDEQLNQVLNVKPENRITIGYCRVSSHKQKDDLERQIDNVKTYLLAKGQPFERRSRSDCVHEQVAKRIANVRFTLRAAWMLWAALFIFPGDRNPGMGYNDVGVKRSFAPN